MSVVIFFSNCKPFFKGNFESLVNLLDNLLGVEIEEIYQGWECTLLKNVTLFSKEKKNPVNALTFFRGRGERGNYTREP